MNRSLNSLCGHAVRANDGEVGRVERFYFDDLTWIVRYVAVTLGRKQPGRCVLISLAALDRPDWKKQVLPVNLTLEQVLKSPTTDLDSPVSREHESDLHGYYAWPVYWDGSFYLQPGYVLPQTLMGFPSPGPDLRAAAQPIEPHLYSTEDIKGCGVHTTDGHIGHVEDCLVDDEAWDIRYLVVNTRNWLPDRRVLISPQWVGTMEWAEHKVAVTLTREAVKESPAYTPSQAVGPEYERKLHRHFQQPETREWVVFTLHAPPGAHVYVAGTFNHWNPIQFRLGDNRKGTYTATILLPQGRHEYKFIVNGNWCNGADGGELVPNAFGTANNVVMVSRTKAHRARLHTFSRLLGSKARPVYKVPAGA